jgi:hypothetical protein
MPPKGKNSEKKDGPIIIKKVTHHKGVPTADLAVELVPDKGVGNYLRVLVGGPGGKTSELIIHRPIGITDLVKEDWVYSTPDEVKTLVSQKRDPRAKDLQDKRLAYVRQEAAKRNLISFAADGSVNLPSGVNRSEYLKRIKKETLEDNASVKDFKYNSDAALAKLDDEDAMAEIAYRKATSILDSEAEEKYPTTFRTRSGPMLDKDQEAVKHLFELTYSEVQAITFKYGVTGPPKDASKKESAFGAIDVEKKLPDQWIVAPKLSKSLKARIRSHLTKVKKELEDAGLEEIVIGIDIKE